MLLLTGARRNEVLAMRWADLNLTDGIWTKPASTTKQKRIHTAPLSAPARQLLAKLSKTPRQIQSMYFPAAGAVIVLRYGKRGTISVALQISRVCAFMIFATPTLRKLASSGFGLEVIGQTIRPFPAGDDGAICAFIRRSYTTGHRARWCCDRQ